MYRNMSSSNNNNNDHYSSSSTNNKVEDGGSEFINYEDFSLANMHQEDIEDYYAENEVSVKGDNIPKPITAFRGLILPKFIQGALDSEGYDKPTPIQAQAWPLALEGRNMVAIAQTGSGKTLGFILPCLLKLSAEMAAGGRRSRNPRVLVLSPTRELAQQTEQVAKKFGGRNILSVCVYGGVPKFHQLQDLRRGVEIVIATPGRLNDFLNQGDVNLSNCSFVVLDEADRMLDMGFEPQVRRIISHIGEGCQTMMFSATWPQSVKRLAEEFLGAYVQVNIGAVSTNPTANHNITQIVEVCGEHEKMGKFFEFVGRNYTERDTKMIIFAETKRKVDQLSNEMEKEGYKVVAIHGDKSQSDRDWILKSFSTGRCNMMVATDVASRGLDVDDIKFVINYDYPNTSEDYIHRIGRTGRRGKTGTAFTFMTRNNAKQAHDLMAVLREAHQEVSQALEQLSRGGGGGFGGGNRSYGGGNRSSGGGSSYGGSSYGGNSSGGNYRSSGYGGGGNSYGGNVSGSGYGAAMGGSGYGGSVRDSWRTPSNSSNSTNSSNNWRNKDSGSNSTSHW